MRKARAILSKILANNPISRIVFLISGKRISFNHLTIRVIAFLLRQKIPFYNATIDVSDKMITPLTKSLLYYRIYEKKEVELVTAYLKSDDDVLELGSSIGVMGSIVSRIQTTGRYISVEADPALINVNRKNITLNRKSEFVLLNKALDYSGKKIAFIASDSTLSGKVAAAGDSETHIDSITLKELCQTYDLNNFTLICDIEGAEISILLNDMSSITKCSKIVIELHDTEYNGRVYSVKDMVDLIVQNNFRIADRQEPAFVFERIDLTA